MAYKVRSHRKFRKDIKKIPKALQMKIYQSVNSLSKSPNKTLLNSKKIGGEMGVYRIRFGKYRLIISVSHKEKVVYIIGVGPRGGVYKIMKRLLS